MVMFGILGGLYWGLVLLGAMVQPVEVGWGLEST